jgi:hypothetical protein
MIRRSHEVKYEYRPLPAEETKIIHFFIDVMLILEFFEKMGLLQSATTASLFQRRRFVIHEIL